MFSSHWVWENIAAGVFGFVLWVAVLAPLWARLKRLLAEIHDLLNTHTPGGLGDIDRRMTILEERDTQRVEREYRNFLEIEAQDRLGMSLEEFRRRYKAGELEDGDPDVPLMAMLAGMGHES